MILLTVGRVSSFVTVTDCAEDKVANALPAVSFNCSDAVSLFVYATETVESLAIAEVSASVTVVPDTVTPVTVFVARPAVTVKSPAAGDPVTLSLIVYVTAFVPASAAAALIVGATASITIEDDDERDPAPPASGKVVTILFSSVSKIVPLFSENGFDAL